MTEVEGVPSIEAHFAGTLPQCNKFIQKHAGIPPGSMVPRSDMCGLVPSEVAPTPPDGTLTSTWRVHNRIQNAILSGTVGDHMPAAFLELDPAQKSIATANPPLLIESRSGTGKTLVLLQHAAFMTRNDQTQPASTTPPQWFAKGMSYYLGEHYMLAARCFMHGEKPGWACYAEGKEH